MLYHWYKLFKNRKYKDEVIMTYTDRGHVIYYGETTVSGYVMRRGDYVYKKIIKPKVGYESSESLQRYINNVSMACDQYILTYKDLMDLPPYALATRVFINTIKDWSEGDIMDLYNGLSAENLSATHVKQILKSYETV